MEWLIAWLVGLFVSGAVGYLIGKPKGRKDEGLILGALLGPLGWIITACLSDKQQGMPLSKVARRGGEWAAGTRPVTQPTGIKLRCPNCGEIGFVPQLNAEVPITCPTCAEKFEAEPNVAAY